MTICPVSADFLLGFVDGANVGICTTGAAVGVCVCGTGVGAKLGETIIETLVTCVTDSMIDFEPFTATPASASAESSPASDSMTDPSSPLSTDAVRSLATSCARPLVSLVVYPDESRSTDRVKSTKIVDDDALFKRARRPE